MLELERAPVVVLVALAGTNMSNQDLITTNIFKYNLGLKRKGDMCSAKVVVSMTSCAGTRL